MGIFALLVLGVALTPPVRAPISNGQVYAAFGPNIIQNSLLTGGPSIRVLCYIDWYPGCLEGQPHDMMWFGTYDYLGITAAGAGSLATWKLPDVPANGTTLEPGPGKWEDTHTQTMLHGGTLTQIDAQNERVTFSGTRANGASYTATLDYYAIPTERTIRVLLNVTNNAALPYDFGFYHAEDVDAGSWPIANNDVNADSNDALSEPGPGCAFLCDASNAANLGAGDPGDTWDERILPYSGASWWTNWASNGVWTSGWRGPGVGYVTVLDANGQDVYDQTVTPAAAGSDGRPDDYSGLFSFESGIDWYVGRWDAASYGPGLLVADPQFAQNGCFTFPPLILRNQYYAWEDVFECNGVYWDGVNNNLLDHDNGVGLLKDIGTIAAGATRSFTFYIGEPPLKPDIVLSNSDITVEPDLGSTYVGTPTWINATVHNGGILPIIDDFTVAAYRDDPDTNANGIIDAGAVLLGSTTVTASPGAPLAFGETRLASIPWTPALADLGPFTIFVTADYETLAPFTDGAVDEVDSLIYEITNNKAFYDTAGVAAGSRPPFRTAGAPEYEIHAPWANLRIDGANITVWPDFGSTYVGRTVLLNATVLNDGVVGVTDAFPVAFYRDDPDADSDGVIDPGAILLGATTIPASSGSPMGPGETRAASVAWIPTMLDVGQFTIYAAVDLQASGPFADGAVDELSGAATEILDNKAYYDTAGYTPGVAPPFVTATPPDYQVHIPPAPGPPENVRTQASGGNVRVTWDPPAFGTADFYEVYHGITPRGIDLITPIGTTLTLSYLHVGAASAPSEHYYLVRAVNTVSGGRSGTSNTAGAFTLPLTAGWNSVSLPLAPYAPLDVAGLQADLGANTVTFLDATGAWVAYPGGPNVAVGVGLGYRADLPAAGLHTFVGFPGAMAVYGAGFGFSPADVASVTASVTPTGDVVLQWAEPAGPIDHYCVRRSSAREGFHTGSSVIIGCTPFSSPSTTAYTDPGAAGSPGEWYYLVVPMSAVVAPGSSAFSVGVITVGFNATHAFGPPLKSDAPMAVSTLASTIPTAMGILWPSEAVWVPHFAAMPAGVYDSYFLQGRGYQIQVRTASLYSFVGT